MRVFIFKIDDHGKNTDKREEEREENRNVLDLWRNDGAAHRRNVKSFREQINNLKNAFHRVKEETSEASNTSTKTMFRHSRDEPLVKNKLMDFSIDDPPEGSLEPDDVQSLTTSETESASFLLSQSCS